MKPLIDWVSVSFKRIYFLDDFFRYLRLPFDAFVPIRGWRSYPNGFWYDCITVYYKPLGIDDLHPDAYEVYVNMSGQGCRRYQTIRGRDFDYVNWFRELLEGFCDAHFSRIDVALDVKDDSVPDMLKIIKLVQDGRYMSKFRRVLPAAGTHEQWAVFGSPQSDVRLRIYNKSMERKVDGKWIRFEYQLRNQSIERFMNHLLRCDLLGQAFGDFISESVTFTKEVNSHDHHQDRLTPAGWWVKFLKRVGDITEFDKPGVDYNMHGITKYISTQVAPTLAAYVQAYGGDTEPLLKMVAEAAQRMTPKQRYFAEEFASGRKTD